MTFECGTCGHDCYSHEITTPGDGGGRCTHEGCTCSKLDHSVVNLFRLQRDEARKERDEAVAKLEKHMQYCNITVP